MAAEVGAYPIRSVDRVCDILDALANSGSGITLTEIATLVDLPKSSVFRYLSALEFRHYVQRAPDASTYRLGPAFRPEYSLGVSRLVAFAGPQLEQLRDKCGETTNLGILDGTAVVHRIVCESASPMRLAARVGDRENIHATALGKAMSAALPDAQVRSILNATGMPKLTPSTITNIDDFLAELEKVRNQGYAVDDAENQADGRCVAVAILDLPFSAGLSVSAPASRLAPTDVPAIAKQLRRIGQKLASQMRQ
jgi:IclR family transcriptional regulator, acetate operon repressor